MYPITLGPLPQGETLCCPCTPWVISVGRLRRPSQPTGSTDPTFLKQPAPGRQSRPTSVLFHLGQFAHGQFFSLRYLPPIRPSSNNLCQQRNLSSNNLYQQKPFSLGPVSPIRPSSNNNLCWQRKPPFSLIPVSTYHLTCSWLEQKAFSSAFSPGPLFHSTHFFAQPTSSFYHFLSLSPIFPSAHFFTRPCSTNPTFLK